MIFKWHKNEWKKMPNRAGTRVRCHGCGVKYTSTMRQVAKSCQPTCQYCLFKLQPSYELCGPWDPACLARRPCWGFYTTGSRQGSLTEHSHYQVFLDGQNPAPRSLAVRTLACDDNGLRVAVLCWKIDLGVAFFTDLWEGKT